MVVFRTVTNLWRKADELSIGPEVFLRLERLTKPGKALHA